ncbi:MAG: pantoate--beta-alanine ligase [Anaerolineae bacterium]|nr:pantoate--beta-alanine ligase [Gemmatimonadaceae bacterium]
MRTLTRIAELREALAEERKNGRLTALVPTMGFLHEGHLTLIDEARGRCPVVVLSIFVNPLQFGPNEDLARYPRDPEGDAQKAAGRGVDILFAPQANELYRGERSVIVTPLALGEEWEGSVRPGHFAGVLTVVAKLFNIVMPNVAVFGQKDAQQVALVRAMVRDLDFPVEIVVVPTKREADGLAMSSRNAFLDDKSRTRALILSRALGAIELQFRNGEQRVDALEKAGWDVLLGEPEVEVDYLAVLDPDTFRRAQLARNGSVIVVAARVGGTRLIDNQILKTP